MSNPPFGLTHRSSDDDQLSLEDVEEVDNESDMGSSDVDDDDDDEPPPQRRETRRWVGGGAAPLTETKNNENELKIGTKENRDVLRLRLIALGLLLLSATTVGIGVYIYVRNSEELKFQSQFEQNVHKVLESLGTKLENTIASIDALVTNMVSHVNATNQTWPYIFIPDFPVRAAKTRAITLGLYIETALLVQPTERLIWEDFAWNHRQWVNKSIEIQKTDENFYGPCIWNTTTTKSIYSDDGDIPYDQFREFMPNWQQYPAIPIFDQNFNWDWLSDANLPVATRKFVDEQKTIISEPYMLYDTSKPEELELQKTLVGWLENFVTPGEDPREPVSDILFPILDELDKVRIEDKNYDPNKHHAVGGIRVPFYWRDTIQFILPAGNNGVVVVFSNNCTVSFTYQINGPKVEYLGRGDLHDTQYDHMKIESSFFDLGSFAVGKSTYTGPTIDDSYCPIQLSVYPSDTMASTYLTKNPIIFTVVAVMIFVFTSIVFLIYDSKVERRQNVVMNSAMKSNKIVSSLLPSHIRDKLMEEEEEKKAPAAETAQAKVGDAQPGDVAYSIKSFLDNDGLPSTCVDKYEESDALRFPEPIADQYQETTVMAASVSGFTVWSINRDPKHIFILLEVLHGSFDAIAKRLKVLKVESMKDAYCAVAGIPDHRKSHAIVIAKFATAIMSKMSILTQRLVVTLGREVSALKLSIGVCSGATTAGVLRSAKTRFQLFGNTVASAELLDRTGCPGRIQCSQKTANILMEAGKGAWLSRRDGAAGPQGRTEMETYWLNAKSTNTPSRTGSTQMSSESEASSRDHHNSFSNSSMPAGRDSGNLLPRRDSASVQSSHSYRDINSSASGSFIGRPESPLKSSVRSSPAITPVAPPVSAPAGPPVGPSPVNLGRSNIGPEVTRPRMGGSEHSQIPSYDPNRSQRIQPHVTKPARFITETAPPPQRTTVEQPLSRLSNSNREYGHSQSFKNPGPSQSAFDHPVSRSHSQERQSHGGCGREPPQPIRPPSRSSSLERPIPRHYAAMEQPESARPQEYSTQRSYSSASSVSSQRKDPRHYPVEPRGSYRNQVHTFTNQYDNHDQYSRNGQYDNTDQYSRNGQYDDTVQYNRTGRYDSPLRSGNYDTGGYDSPQRDAYYDSNGGYREDTHRQRHFVDDNLRAWIQNDVNRSGGR